MPRSQPVDEVRRCWPRRLSMTPPPSIRIAYFERRTVGMCSAKEKNSALGE